MGDVEIRTITDDEREAWIRAVDLSFSAITKDDEIASVLPVIETDRSFAAVDGGRFVATSAAITFRMVVPGGNRVPGAGITAVGVNPTHRRRGINTRMMAALLDQAAERGEPFAALFASEGGIYGRFGYGLASFLTEFQSDATRMDYVRGVEISGSIELVSKEEALPIISRIYDASLRPGGPERADADRDLVFSHLHEEERDKPWFYAIHRDDGGEPDAYAVYTMKHEWPRSIPTGTVDVKESMASTSDGYAAIWRYVFDIDLVSTVTAWNRPPDEPLMLLLREPRRLRAGLVDGLWVRLVDIPAALGARRYALDGRLVVEVSDAFRPATAGRYELIVEDGVGRCEQTDAEPDVVGSVNVLGSVYLGGVSFSQLAEASRVEVRNEKILPEADTMFSSNPAPWCPWAF
jgi:predicted acetyltransferase